MIIDVQKNYFEKYTTPDQLEKIVDYPSISHMWQDCVNKYADHDAIEDRAKYTYKEMDEDIALFRGLLKSIGVKKGDMVGVLVQNSYEFIRAYLAIQTLGAVAVLMPVHVEGEEFEPVKVKKVYDLPWFLRALVTVVDVIFFRFNPVIWIFKYFGLGYNPVTLDRLFNPF